MVSFLWWVFVLFVGRFLLFVLSVGRVRCIVSGVFVVCLVVFVCGS